MTNFNKTKKQISKKILVSSLEPSANLHLKNILKYINYDYELVGIFDKALGLPLYDPNEFAVMGIVDGIKKYFKAKEAIKELGYLSLEADIVLLIDAPSFNLTLAKEIKKRDKNKKIVYYILPKVWVWKKYRAKIINDYIDEAISIFPFEKKYFKNIRYFGNPLLDEIKTYKKHPTTNKTVAYLAGSRKSEILSLMDEFKKTATMLKDYKKLLVIPPHFNKDEIVKYYGNIDDFEITRDTHKALIQSSFAFICSGTATLEAALIGTPFVLVYRAKKIDYFLINLIANKIKYVGLANIIFDEFNLGEFHKELLQDEFNSKNLLFFLKNSDSEAFLEKTKKLRELLKGKGIKEISKLL